MRTTERAPRAAAAAAGLATALTTALVAAVPVPASAEVVDRGSFQDAFAESFDDFCGVTGLTVDVDTVVEGRYLLVSRGSGTDPYFNDRIRVHQTFTNAATGAVATSREVSLNKDLLIERDGDLVTITVMGVGNATVYGADGKAVARNPGQTRFRVVIDDGGTPEDFADDVELSFEIVKGSTGRSDDFCDALVGVLT